MDTKGTGPWFRATVSQQNGPFRRNWTSPRTLHTSWLTSEGGGDMKKGGRYSMAQSPNRSSLYASHLDVGATFGPATWFE